MSYRPTAVTKTDAITGNPLQLNEEDEGIEVDIVKSKDLHGTIDKTTASEPQSDNEARETSQENQPEDSHHIRHKNYNKIIPKDSSDSRLHKLFQKYKSIKAQQPSEITTATEDETLHTQITHEELDSFLHNAIHLLKHQRIEGDQFAFLFVSKDSNIADNKFRTLEKTVKNSTDATNSEFPSYPPTNLLGNYICARPDKSNPQNIKHAERILLERLESLITIYEENNHQECKIIILYTWLLPCPRCADEIIATLGSPGKYDKYRRVLAYTSATIPNTIDSSRGARVGESKRNIRKHLERAGIEVFQKREQTIL